MKMLSIVAGAIIALLGLVAASNLGVGAAFVSLILAVVIGGAFYISGIIVAAQGQIVLAILDIAVNTSPLLSLEEKTEVITSLRGPGSGPLPAQGQLADATGVNPPTIKCPSCGETVYATAKVCSSCWKPLR